jgi:hypothetical protein
MNERIKELAEQVYGSAHYDDFKFAALVAAHEREECAKIAEEWSVGIDDPRYQCDCATAIRARGEK